MFQVQIRFHILRKFYQYQLVDNRLYQSKSEEDLSMIHLLHPQPFEEVELYKELSDRWLYACQYG